ncbi:MAG: hypothetical protein LBQ50_02845, partial [Planctomycetaceae bacterium]|nr:hypothetical protein [Planctomycetaceae bacterium]
MKNCVLFFVCLFFAVSSFVVAAEPVLFGLRGDGWTLFDKNGSGQWTIDKPELITVTAEKYDKLPLFNEKGAEYNRGMKLHQIRAQECPT